MRSTPKLLQSVTVALTLLFSIVATEGLTDDFQGYPPDIKRIKERGKLIVAMYYKDVRPFMFHKDGLLVYEDEKGYLVKDDGSRVACDNQPEICGYSNEYFIGHDVELARSIADALDVEVEFDRSPRTFNAITDLVASEKADMAISLVSRTLTRAEKVRFSNPYLTLKPIILMNRLDAERYQIDPDDPLGFLIHEGGSVSLPDAAYRLCRYEPGTHVILSGTGNPEHLKANIESFFRPPLPQEDLMRLKSIFQRVDSVSGG